MITATPFRSLKSIVAGCSMVLVAAAVLATHRLADLTSPQFFEEEGSVFFPAAYQHGGASVFDAYAGHLDILPRLVAWVVQPLGLANAPLVFKLVALVVQAAPAVFLLSHRMVAILPTFRGRALLAVLYVAIPMPEGQANLTNSSWFLGLLALLVLVSTPKKTIGWRLFDVIVIVFAALDGGMGIILAPIAVASYFLMPREGWRLTLAVVICVCLVPQLGALLSSPRHATGTVLPPNAAYLLDIMGGVHVALPAATGVSPGGALVLARLGSLALPLISVATLGIVSITVFALTAAPPPLRLAIVMAGMTLAAGIFNPPSGSRAVLWQQMALDGGAQRYFILPVLATVAAAVWALHRVPRHGAKVVTAYAMVVVLGAGLTWRLSPLPDYDVARMATVLAAAPSGARLTFPVFPGQTMVIVKR